MYRTEEHTFIKLCCGVFDKEEDGMVCKIGWFKPPARTDGLQLNFSPFLSFSNQQLPLVFFFCSGVFSFKVKKNV